VEGERSKGKKTQCVGWRRRVEAAKEGDVTCPYFRLFSKIASMELTKKEEGGNKLENKTLQMLSFFQKFL